MFDFLDASEAPQIFNNLSIFSDYILYSNYECICLAHDSEESGRITQTPNLAGPSPIVLEIGQDTFVALFCVADW